MFILIYFSIFKVDFYVRIIITYIFIRKKHFFYEKTIKSIDNSRFCSFELVNTFVNSSHSIYSLQFMYIYLKLSFFMLNSMYYKNFQLPNIRGNYFNQVVVMSDLVHGPNYGNAIFGAKKKK